MNQTDLQGETERALRADILGAVARGWCSLENAAKVMDVDVANAITAELLPLFNAGISGAYAAAATRLDELADAQDALSENLSKRGKIEEAQECAEICEHLREAAISIRALTPADARQAQQIGSEYLIYVPGHFRCTECGFQLSKQTLSAQTGNIGITENNLVTERCPNDGTMMVKATWREAAENASERLTEVFNERDAACAAIASAEARARLEGRAQLLDEMIREIKLDGLCMPINHQAMLDYLERLAATRTPDSTKEPE